MKITQEWIDAERAWLDRREWDQWSEQKPKIAPVKVEHYRALIGEVERLRKPTILAQWICNQAHTNEEMQNAAERLCPACTRARLAAAEAKHMVLLGSHDLLVKRLAAADEVARAAQLLTDLRRADRAHRVPYVYHEDLQSAIAAYDSHRAQEAQKGESCDSQQP